MLKPGWERIKRDRLIVELTLLLGCFDKMLRSSCQRTERDRVVAELALLLGASKKCLNLVANESTESNERSQRVSERRRTG